MKKIISILLCILFSFNQVYAYDLSDLLNRNTSKGNSNSMELLYSHLNSNKRKNLKLLSNEKEVEEEIKRQSEEKDITKRKIDNNAYIKGIDISKWNGDIDWNKVKKAGIEFVIIRAGYGTTHIDKKFEDNIENAIKHKMLIGIYWFSYATNTKIAKQEAIACYNVIKKYKKNITLPVFWDFEYDSIRYSERNGAYVNKKLASAMADNFCRQIKSYGFHTGVYTNIDYSNRYFSKEVLNKYHVWIAQWRSECTYKDKYILWQKTDRFKISNKIFDLNYFYYGRYRGEIDEEKN